METAADGVKTETGTGPKSKDGGFFTRILIREKGSVSKSIVTLSGVVNAEGKLEIRCTMDAALAPVEVKEFNGRTSLVPIPIRRALWT